MVDMTPTAAVTNHTADVAPNTVIHTAASIGAKKLGKFTLVRKMP